MFSFLLIYFYSHSYTKKCWYSYGPLMNISHAPTRDFSVEVRRWEAMAALSWASIHATFSLWSPDASLSLASPAEEDSCGSGHYHLCLACRGPSMIRHPCLRALKMRASTLCKDVRGISVVAHRIDKAVSYHVIFRLCSMNYHRPLLNSVPSSWS